MLLCACGGDDGLKKSTETGIDEDDDNTTATINDDYTYQIPVIFHVIYSDKDDPLQYVSSTRLSNILDNVNEIYKGGIYGESQNINVKFFLATTDEKGNKLSTPGIEYIKWPGDYP
ncbi:MAG: zinc-dependent metalloproteinase lipoprotein, partial [Prevotella sp.]|nr:zinc-dependent metalloproteinase lipoprotein [Prevotella sp.]